MQYGEESLKTRQADSLIPLGYSFFIKWVILFIVKRRDVRDHWVQIPYFTDRATEAQNKDLHKMTQLVTELDLKGNFPSFVVSICV